MSDHGTKEIVTLPGDGIGPEVTREAVAILQAVCKHFDFELKIREMPFGGASLREYGVPLTGKTLEACRQASAVFLGAVGDPEMAHYPKDKRPEAGLLRIRKELGLFANLRPIKIHKPLIGASSLKATVIQDVDIMIVRELASGIYFGEPRSISAGESGHVAVDTMQYHRHEIKRIAKAAFDIAAKRKKNVCSVDKANVLDSSRLWRQTVTQSAADHPKTALRHLLVDNCAMQLVRDPAQFDVILTSNMFGDILSDEASMLTGSIGMLPSASLGDGVALFEPVHGSAPDIAGQAKANPMAAIASAAMLCRYAFELEEAALAIEKAMADTLSQGVRTQDIFTNSSNEQLVSTREMGAALLDNLTAPFQKEKWVCSKAAKPD